MKTLITTLALWLAIAGSAFAQSQPSLRIDQRLNYFTAEFAWTTFNSTAAVEGWIVECGKTQGVYTEHSGLILTSTLAHPVRSIIPFDNKNHFWYCVVSAQEGPFLVSPSNEVILQVRGRSIWVIEE